MGLTHHFCLRYPVRDGMRMMADIQDIPALIREFYELAKAYLLQETVEPAKKLGHFAGFSLAAGALWSAAVVLLSVAGLRALYDALPDSPYWEALGYVIFALVLFAFMAILVKFVPDRGVHDAYGDPVERGDV
ncbi:MAG: hypothetical protein BMS9Abin20_1280 [Acidimicrobiia bacterium]|nr:MAG: hypothetical protein BMS9Abin20_1280 [Acidimicrobiia bacterium]